MKTHTVVKGDTMHSIARKEYGYGWMWRVISIFNPSIRPSKIEIGQPIRVPFRK